MTWESSKSSRRPRRQPEKRRLSNRAWIRSAAIFTLGAPSDRPLGRRRGPPERNREHCHRPRSSPPADRITPPARPVHAQPRRQVHTAPRAILRSKMRGRRARACRCVGMWTGGSEVPSAPSALHQGRQVIGLRRGPRPGFPRVSVRPRQPLVHGQPPCRLRVVQLVVVLALLAPHPVHQHTDVVGLPVRAVRTVSAPRTRLYLRIRHTLDRATPPGTPGARAAGRTGVQARHGAPAAISSPTRRDAGSGFRGMAGPVGVGFGGRQVPVPLPPGARPSAGTRVPALDAVDLLAAAPALGSGGLLPVRECGRRGSRLRRGHRNGGCLPPRHLSDLRTARALSQRPGRSAGMAGSRPGLPALSTVLPLRQTVWGRDCSARTCLTKVALRLKPSRNAGNCV